MSDWISVEEMLPGFKLPRVVTKPVLVHCQGGDIGVGQYFHDSRGWLVAGKNPGTKVTHWMPLPEPPKVPK